MRPIDWQASLPRAAEISGTPAARRQQADQAQHAAAAQGAAQAAAQTEQVRQSAGARPGEAGGRGVQGDTLPRGGRRRRERRSPSDRGGGGGQAAPEDQAPGIAPTGQPGSRLDVRI